MEESLFAMPALWYPGQSDEEWQDEVDAMVERAHITAAFMRGEVYVDSFLDYLNEKYVNPLELAESWELDECLISI